MRPKRYATVAALYAETIKHALKEYKGVDDCMIHCIQHVIGNPIPYPADRQVDEMDAMSAERIGMVLVSGKDPSSCWLWNGLIYGSCVKPDKVELRKWALDLCKPGSRLLSGVHSIPEWEIPRLLRAYLASLTLPSCHGETWNAGIEEICAVVKLLSYTDSTSEQDIALEFAPLFTALRVRLIKREFHSTDSEKRAITHQRGCLDRGLVPLGLGWDSEVNCYRQ